MAAILDSQSLDQMDAVDCVSVMARTTTHLISKILAGHLWFSKAVGSKAVFFVTVDELPGARHYPCVATDIVQIVGSTVRRLREERGISQEEFAHLAGLDRSFYGRIERGTQNIALKTLCIVATSLQVHPAVLLEDITDADCTLLNPSGR